MSEPKHIYGWYFIINGPCKNMWLPIEHDHGGSPNEELEIESEYHTMCKHVRSPKSDFPGVYCYRFEGELTS